MTHPMSGAPSFIAEFWRKRPLLLKGAIPDTLRKPLTFERFRRWCETATRARIYTRTGHTDRGKAVARKLHRASDGLVLYDHFSAQGEPITLLLNGTEKIDPHLRDLQSFFGIPYEWRRDDTVATLSAAGAGIGYHGGSEDGFIVQLEGEREWSVWSPDVLSKPYREFLCGNPDEPEPDARTHVAPLLTVGLEPGDALYVPALFPHEGVTRKESLSLSMGWRGLSAFQVLNEIRAGGETVPPEHAGALYRLLDDPPPDADAKAFVRAELKRLFDALPGRMRPADEQVDAWSDRLFANAARPAAADARSAPKGVTVQA